MHTAPFHLPIRQTDGYTLAAMPEEIDALNSDRVGEHLLGLFDSGTSPVIIDLTGTTFCDSSAVKALLRTRTRARAVDRELFAVAPPRGSVRRMFDLVAISRLIPVHDDVESAITAVLKNAPLGR